MIREYLEARGLDHVDPDTFDLPKSFMYETPYYKNKKKDPEWVAEDRMERSLVEREG